MDRDDLLKRLSFLGGEHDSLMSTEKLQEIYENIVRKMRDSEAYKIERNNLISALIGLEHARLLSPGKTMLYINKNNEELKNIIRILLQSSSNE